MATNKTDATSSELTYYRTDDFFEAYANNVYYEVSAWDLKLIFGQLDQSGGEVKVEQHTAITVPWPQIKLLTYWLRGHVEAYELSNGKIQMPPAIIPDRLPPVTEELKKQDPNAEAIYALFNRLREELLASLKA